MKMSKCLGPQNNDIQQSSLKDAIMLFLSVFQLSIVCIDINLK